MQLAPINSRSAGLEVQREIIHCVTAISVTKGTVYRLDLSNPLAGAANSAVDVGDEVFGNVVAVSGTPGNGDIYVLALQTVDGSADATQMVQMLISGYEDVPSGGFSGSPANGDPLFVNSSGQFITGPNGDKIVGIKVNDQNRVLFDGMHGFGERN